MSNSTIFFQVHRRTVQAEDVDGEDYARMSEQAVEEQ